MDFREAKKTADEAMDLSKSLFRKEKLSHSEKGQMLTAAFGTLYIWSKFGTPLQVARSQWWVSRVLCKLEEAKLALFHAQLADFYLKQASDRKDFDGAYILEALARATALKGDKAKAMELKSQALLVATSIRDQKDKEEFQAAFSEMSWFGADL
jgi:hypothetical protein